MSYDNTKQVILRKVVSDKPNAPAMSVSFEAGGQKYQAGLWAWTKKDGTPVKDRNGNQLYQGEYKLDEYTPTAQPSQQPQHPEAADDIPF